MDTWSAAAAAAALDTTVARIDRAAREGRVRARRDHRGHWRFSTASVDALRRRWGTAPKGAGCDRETLFVLAAVSRRPGGLVSTRAVARVAGVSPTTAANRLTALEHQGLVRQRTRRLVAGRARDVTVWEADWTSSAWPAIAAAVAATRLAEGDVSPAAAAVPGRLGHLFWNADRTEIDLAHHGAYAAGRILDAPETDGLAWAFGRVTPDDWRAAARRRGTSPRRRALARNLADAGERPT